MSERSERGKLKGLLSLLVKQQESLETDINVPIKKNPYLRVPFSVNGYRDVPKNGRGCSDQL